MVGWAPASAAGPSPRDARATAAFSGKIRLPSGRGIYLRCAGRGTPTVMLESGLHGPSGEWTTKDVPTQTQPTVFAGLARTTRVCAYDRPGTALGPGLLGRSDPVRMPRSTGAMVADLRALQRAARIPGPYVFAGHSMGGLIVRQYTSLYPRSVAGLVMVDALSETMETYLSISDWNAYNQLLPAPPRGLEGFADSETVDFRQSFAQMRRAGVRPPRRIPSIVISKGRPFGIPGRLGRVIDAAWVRSGNYLARLQPGTPHLIARDSGHEIEFEDPQLIIDATRRVIRAVRRGPSFTG